MDDHTYEKVMAIKKLTIIELYDGASGYCNGSIYGSVYMENLRANGTH